MPCWFCGYGAGCCVAACPEMVSGEAEHLLARQVWDAGFAEGRAGRELPADASATKRLGHRYGVIALEEAQNGVQWCEPDPEWAQLG